MSKRRHSSEEIAAKLHEAETLIGQGQRQREVARSLGISVMTFHRWRKAQNEQVSHDQGRVNGQDADERGIQERGQKIADLQLENSRLRRLVTDLLLEKIKLEESAASLEAKHGQVKHASH
jgi:putative transposase